MARTDNLTNFLTDVADAIKQKKGDTTAIQASEFDTEIANLPSGEDISKYFTDTLPVGTGATITTAGWVNAIKTLPPLPFNGTEAKYSYAGFPGLELDLSLVDTSNLVSLNATFRSCSNLSKLNLNDCDFGNVNTVTTPFFGCTGLTDLNFAKNLGKSFTKATKVILSDSTKLTAESLMSVINNLYDLNITFDVTNGGKLLACYLDIGSTNLAKLTDEQIAIATEKGWIVQ